MIYLVNFFARKIEAISRQVEEARQDKKDPIITCCYFLGQKPLNIKDIKDNIWIFPKKIYPIVAFIVIVLTNCDIHIFEDEPSIWRKISLNFRKRKIYVSLFKDINKSLINYLNKIKFINLITVEDEDSFIYISKNLKNKNIKVKLLYPSPLWVPKPTTTIDNNHLLFASWNGGSKQDLIDRGIYDLLFLVKQTKSTCSIVIRDNETDFLKKLIKKHKLDRFIKIVNPTNYKSLKEEFEKANYVVLIPRKAIMKYVPNSLIDGLSLGKPCIISKKLRFCNTVIKNKIGLFFSYKEIKSFKLLSLENYKIMSFQCTNWSKKNLFYSYKKNICKLYK